MKIDSLDFESIEGYSKLSLIATKVFERVYKLHSASLGKTLKDDYRPVKVKERNTHLEVYFKNGQWLHYLPNGTWY